MSQSEFQETERVESPFGRRSLLVRTSATAEEPRQTEAAPAVAARGSDVPPADVESSDGVASEESSPASVRVQRLQVRVPRRLTGLRPLTGYEEELLEDDSRFANTAALCNELLARCLVSLDEPSNQASARVGALLVAERDAALVDLRRLTFGDRVETDVACPSCGEATHVSFDLTQVSLEVADVAEALELTLTDGTVVWLRLPTAQDQVDLLAAGLPTAAERRTWLIERAIRRFGDLEGPLGFDRVHALDSRTRRQLEAELEKEIPDLDLRVGSTCEGCGREFAAPFDITSFFLPS